jgi:hypothetical protein
MWVPIPVPLVSLTTLLLCIVFVANQGSAEEAVTRHLEDLADASTPIIPRSRITRHPVVPWHEFGQEHRSVVSGSHFVCPPLDEHRHGA